MGQENVKVVVTISGGCCTGVYGGSFVEVAVVDFDNDSGGQIWLAPIISLSDMQPEVTAALEQEVPMFIGT